MRRKGSLFEYRVMWKLVAHREAVDHRISTRWKHDALCAGMCFDPAPHQSQSTWLTLNQGCDYPTVRIILTGKWLPIPSARVVGVCPGGWLKTPHARAGPPVIAPRARLTSPHCHS